MRVAERRVTEDKFDLPGGFRRLERQQTTRFVGLLEPSLGPLKRYVAAVLRHSPDVVDSMISCNSPPLKAYVHLDQFRFEAQFGSWLKSIAANEIRQLRRQRWRLRSAEELNRSIADGRQSVQAAWERNETTPGSAPSYPTPACQAPDGRT